MREIDLFSEVCELDNMVLTDTKTFRNFQGDNFRVYRPSDYLYNNNILKDFSFRIFEYDIETGIVNNIYITDSTQVVLPKDLFIQNNLSTIRKIKIKNI